MPLQRVAGNSVTLVQAKMMSRAIGRITTLCVTFVAGCSPGAALPDKEQVFLVGGDGFGLRQLSHDDRFHGTPAWSPDGRWIASATSGVRRSDGGFVDTPGALELLASDGSTTRVFHPGGFPSRPTWTGAGRLAFLARSEAPDPGTPATLVVMTSHGRILRRGALGRVAEDAAWSPHGRTLAFVRGCQCTPRRGPQPDIVLIDSNGRHKRLLTNTAQSENSLTWAPGGHALLFVRGTSVWRTRRDGGPPQPLMSDVIIAFAAWSPDARTIIVGAVTFKGDRRFHLYTLSVTGGRPRQLTGEVATQPPAWSPDGRVIAFVNAEPDTIQTIRPDGSHHRTLARLPGAQIGDLAWSPDGRRIAFTAGRKPPEE